MTKMYRSISNDAEVIVEPKFLGANGETLYGWEYSVKITNTGFEPLMLVSRHFDIYSFLLGEYHVMHIDGNGIRGETPIIQPNLSYQYISSITLPTHDNIFTGMYRARKIDSKKLINLKIPPSKLQPE